MPVKFDGVVRTVTAPEHRSVTKGDGTTSDLTKVRVVSESKERVDKVLPDGRTVKAAAHSDFFDVEGWGGPARQLARLDVGEKVHIAGLIHQTKPVTLDDGKEFYPKDRMVVNSVDFLGQPRKVAAAQAAVGQEVAADVMDSPMTPDPALEPF